MTTYVFINDDEKKVAAAGIAVIVARVQSMGQFSVRVNEDWATKEKKKLIDGSVEEYMNQLLGIGFNIQLNDEEGED